MLDGEEDEGDGGEHGGGLDGVGPVQQRDDARRRVGLTARRFRLDRAAHHVCLKIFPEFRQMLIWKKR